jgi:hypothetical protein
MTLRINDTQYNGFVCDIKQKDTKYNNIEHNGFVCDTDHK